MDYKRSLDSFRDVVGVFEHAGFPTTVNLVTMMVVLDESLSLTMISIFIFFSLCIPLNCFIIFSRAASFARRSADCPIPVLPVGSEAWSAFTARRHVAHGGVDAKLQVSDTDQHATALAWPSLLRYGRCALLWNMWPVLHYCVLPFYSMDYDEKRYA